MKSKRLRVALIAAMLAVAAAGCTPKPDAKPPAAAGANLTLTPAQRARIRVYTVTPVGFRKTVESNGVVDFDNDQATSVLAPFSGPVSRLLVAAGDKVSKGQPLATVYSADFSTAVGAYSKALATAQTTRKLADADKDLLAHNGISQREAQQAETDAVNAAADRDAALQALVALNLDPQTLKAIEQGRPVARVEGVIRAPIAGTVAERLITPGQLLQAGSTPCFTVADLSKVWVMAQISDSDVASVAVGDTADIVTDAGKTEVGTVANISAVVNPDTRSVVARVVAANPGEMLKKQMYVRVLLHSRATGDALIVPVSAVLHDDENLPFVYVAQADNTYARQRVTLGGRSGDLYQIADGLRPGVRVVVDGGIFLQFIQSQ